MPHQSDPVFEDEDLDEDQVSAYLKANPDFLLRHPALVGVLATPPRWQEGGVADLQSFRIQRLQQELDEMRDCAEHLIANARSNMSTLARTHAAALAILAASDMAELAAAINDELPELLDVDVATLAFEEGEIALPVLAARGIQRIPVGGVPFLLGDKDVLLQDNAFGDPGVFGEGAGLVRSCAMTRLEVGEPCPPGVLALGARGEDTFHPGQASDLLLFLNQVLEHAIRRWVMV
ncbi:MAG: DUF484 family protein [Rhodospirillales bacterium]|nr:DUF484 family protein [Rhodospirillales bacterium]